VFPRRLWFPSESVPPRPVLVLWPKRPDVGVFGEFIHLPQDVDEAVFLSLSFTKELS